MEKQRGITPFYYAHTGKNLSLLLLSVLTIPLSAAVVLLSLLYSRLIASAAAPTAAQDAPRRAVLVTGVSMTKGLTIARLLSRHSNHRVLGADISALSPARFSRALEKYYVLSPPVGEDARPYIESLLSVIRDEGVELWISCSSVIAAVEDGQVVRLAREQAAQDGRRFEAVQFSEDEVEKFHSKDSFASYMESLNLSVPDSHRVTSSAEALSHLAAKKPETYILKPIGVDDSARNKMMTLLPFASEEENHRYVSVLSISSASPFQLQRYIPGAEFCTHALVIRGRVTAFVACPSAELLMHYVALPRNSSLSRAMEKFTVRVAEAGGRDFTGHLSFDFLVPDPQAEEPEIWVIECNPRAHTAVVLFADTPAMVGAYMSIFSGDEKNADIEVVTPLVPTAKYYWAGHELVASLLLPVLDFVLGLGTRDGAVDGVKAFVERIATWRDGTLVVWDPVPFFVLYHVYWPGMFVQALAQRKTWSRVNVSTTKMFA